jgi:hypothetical protein
VRRSFAACFFVAACSIATANHARAAVIEGPVAGTAVALGTIGGMATSVAAIVYAFDNRAFDTSWVITSLITSAICGSTSVALMVSGDVDSFWGVTGVMFYAALTIWPGYYVVRTSLSSVDPGDRFDAYDTEVAPAPTEDLEEEIEEEPAASLSGGGSQFAITLPIRF